MNKKWAFLAAAFVAVAVAAAEFVYMSGNGKEKPAAEVQEAKKAIRPEERLPEAKELPAFSEKNEKAAVGSLRTLNTACVTYFAMYSSFPPSLEVMGTPPGGKSYSADAAGLLDASLAAGFKDGYEFTYRASKAGQPGFTQYQITASPRVFGVDGRRNFFTDESGVVRAIPANRKASSSDPPL